MRAARARQCSLRLQIDLPFGITIETGGDFSLAGQDLLCAGSPTTTPTANQAAAYITGAADVAPDEGAWRPFCEGLDLPRCEEFQAWCAAEREHRLRRSAAAAPDRRPKPAACPGSSGARPSDRRGRPRAMCTDGPGAAPLPSRPGRRAAPASFAMMKACRLFRRAARPARPAGAARTSGCRARGRRRRAPARLRPAGHAPRWVAACGPQSWRAAAKTCRSVPRGPHGGPSISVRHARVPP